MDILIIILGALMVLVGIAGSVLPVLPGLPVSWLGLLLLKFTERAADELSWSTVLWTGLFMLVVSLLDSILPVWGTKKLGGGRRVVVGASLGLLFGFFAGLPGILLGPFVGAFLGGLTEGHSFWLSIRQAMGAFLGFFAGIFLKLVCGGVIAWCFVAALL
ncbi:MAG: DUF456 domain-containing protein [Bacteroidales bacterium]|jgi:uncharacterized protein|nr:DUF456 domain-containing protein [Bacteroidales bacterium]